MAMPSMRCLWLFDAFEGWEDEEDWRIPVPLRWCRPSTSRHPLFPCFLGHGRPHRIIVSLNTFDGRLAFLKELNLTSSDVGKDPSDALWRSGWAGNFAVPKAATSLLAASSSFRFSETSWSLFGGSFAVV